MPLPISLRRANDIYRDLSTTIPAAELAIQRGIDEIVPGLFLSDCITAQSLNAPHYTGPPFTHVLSVLSPRDMGPAGWMPHPGPSTPEVQRKVVVLEDRVHVDIMQHFAECADWIREAFNPVVPTERTPLVLVHCVRGISRSATIVLAYVIREDPVQDGEGDVCERAVAWLRTRRRIAGPNSGFREQLEVWVQCEFDLFERDAAGLVMREKEMYKAHKKVLRRRYRWRDRVRDWVGVWMDRVLL